MGQLYRVSRLDNGCIRVDAIAAVAHNVWCHSRYSGSALILAASEAEAKELFVVHEKEVMAQIDAPWKV